MKKTIYLAALAALALTACSNDTNEIFDQSAAERLEQYKKEYADVLTSDGGLWTMEYFSNPDEPGYLFVMKFDKNGSVEVSANHKWIDDQFKQEVSLWKMIADNGPVLSFNSYNTLFHIFADPANIVGPNAPTGEEGDIIETGYGHEGDYEFQVMEVADEGKTVRLLGKKRMIDIYLHRLDPSTDVKEYMDGYKAMSESLFSSKIPTLFFDDAEGGRYVINGAHTGVLSIYPADGDPVDQTRSGNFIITESGIRFMRPLEIIDALGTPKTISEFKFVGNRTLASVENENSTISAGSIAEVFNVNRAAWNIDYKNATGGFKDKLDALVDQLRTLYKNKYGNVNDMAFEYDSTLKSYVLRMYLRTTQKNYVTIKFFVDFADADGKLKVNVGEACDETSQLSYKAYTTLADLFALFNAASLPYSIPSDCGPTSMVLEIGGGELSLNVR